MTEDADIHEPDVDGGAPASPAETPPPAEEDADADASKEEPPTTRRGFFREALAGMLTPLVSFIEDRLPTDFGLGMIDDGLYSGYCEHLYNSPGLRPPGALDADAFAEACTGCGDCATACPAGAIRLDPDPRIDPDLAGCRMCEGLPCVAACKTGALLPVDRADIKMGLAVWDSDHCAVLSGADCDACRVACPVGAVDIREGYVFVDDEACTGCGLCQTACPAEDKGIAVEPY